MQPSIERHGGHVLQFPPRPRRIEVQISARDGPAPIGRTRPHRLRESDLQELIEFLGVLEGRR